MKKLIAVALCLLPSLSVAQTPVQTESFGNYINTLPSASTINQGDQFYIRQNGTSMQVPGSIMQTVPTQSSGTNTTATASTAFVQQGLGGVNTYNLNPMSLLRWRLGMANVLSGAAFAKLMIIGSSSAMGYGSGSGGPANNAYQNSWPQRLAAALNIYVPTQTLSIFGDQFQPLGATAYGTYDPRVTLGANWAADTSGPYGPGGYGFKFTTGSANNFSFTPSGQINQIVVFFDNTQTGTFTVNVDGGGALTASGITGSGAYVFQGYGPPTLGSHTVNIVPANNGNIKIWGILCRNTSSAAVTLEQMGMFGATMQTVTTGQTSPFTIGGAIEFQNPDLVIIALMVNDFLNSTPVATFQTNLQNLITSIQGQTPPASIILMTGQPVQSEVPGADQTPYIAAMETIALSNNIPMFNLHARWQTWAITNAFFPYFDSVHSGVSGYADVARALAEAIRPK